MPDKSRRMPDKPSRKKIPGGYTPAMAGVKVPPALVGDRNNYNLQPEVTEYQLWPFSTIEWLASENRYRARAMVEQKTTHDNVAFNSYHQAYIDAERAIATISDSLHGIGDRRVYNVFGEVIDVHTADHGGGMIVNVIEVQVLVWSMDEIPTP